MSSKAPQHGNEAIHQNSEWHHEPGHDPPRSDQSSRPGTSPNNQGWYWITEEEHVKSQPASTYKTDEARFQDLHDRITVLAHALDVLYQDLSTLRNEQQRQYDEIMHWLSPTHDHAEASRRVLSEMERMVKAIKNDVESKDYREHLNQLHETVKEGHATIATSSRLLQFHVLFTTNTNCTAAVIDGSGRYRFFFFLLVATQIGLFISYVIYRRRLDSQPKKYL